MQGDGDQHSTIKDVLPMLNDLLVGWSVLPPEVWTLVDKLTHYPGDYPLDAHQVAYLEGLHKHYRGNVQWIEWIREEN